MTVKSSKKATIAYNETFLKYIEAFTTLGQNSKLFPKVCQTCKREYANFPEYIHHTSPLAHGLEPYKDGLDALHTMQYRNCHCGSTLCIDLTEQDYPLLESFWEMLGKESKSLGKPVREVVLSFREQCNQYIEESVERSND